VIMILLIGLFIGLVCGLLAATKAGFVSSWTRLFNSAVAVYIAVYLTPMIASSTAIVNEHHYGAVLCAIVIFVVTFLILNAICMVILGDLKIEMSKIFDAVGGGVMGFANGVLVWGFLCLLLCISPLAKASMTSQICSPDEVRQMWCSSVGANMAAIDFISFQNPKYTLAEVIEKIQTEGMPKPKPPKEVPVPQEEVEEGIDVPVSTDTPEG
jgi:uncharacterized membrane protein required for colicin V production